MDSNPEVEYHIGRNVPWTKLPVKVKEIFGQSQKGYERAIITYSIRNQLRFSENLIKTIRKDEGKYYEDVVAYSKEHLMLYPYHLSDRVVKGLRITPFQYYTSVLEMIVDQEKSYDSLPNFTAADCLRLLGIGRNQYIELMNKYRASRKLFRRKPPRELLPAKPVDIGIDPWFVVQVGYIVEEDMALVKTAERKIIDYIIDNGGQPAGTLDYDCVHSLYRKGLVYLDVPITSEDYIVVPPLEGFVMNRVLGDYFETLLYKIFVSIDEHTTVGELSTVLDIEAQLIQNAVSLYCRLGFAYKKNIDIDSTRMDPSWKKYHAKKSSYAPHDESSIVDELTSALAETDESEQLSANTSSELKGSTAAAHTFWSGTTNSNVAKRIAFLYDSTLTAFLMMGNLSPGLKNHAVTMFEVGKMSDESLDSFLSELENISWTEGEGEAQRYFEHAKTLRASILFLRNNPEMGNKSLDLLRCESLLNLDTLTCSRLLNKNYEILVSMAPLSYEVKPVCSDTLPHFGPAIPHVNSIWFKLFLYSVTQGGPTSLLLSRGSLLHALPLELQDCNKYLVTSWGHDSSVIPGANALFTINEALTHSAVFLQAYGTAGESSTVIVPFPLTQSQSLSSPNPSKQNQSPSHQMYAAWAKHPVILKLSEIFDLESNCGFITMVNIRGSASSQQSTSLRDMQINPERIRENRKGHPLLPESSPLPNLDEEETLLSFTEDHLVVDDADRSNVSSVPEPKNGFTDDHSAKLYEEELAHEFEDAGTKPTVFDSRKQKIETLRLNLGDLDINSRQTKPPGVEFRTTSNGQPSTIQNNLAKDNSWYDDWTLLDCQFGLPLFDAGVNQVVCEQLVAKGLLKGHSLENLAKFNKELGRSLTDFIRTNQAPNLWSEDIPFPSKSFYCLNGKLQEYHSTDSNNK